jgi:ABC-type polysaccharide/polyol phosphate transport system ATPase subunit
MRSNGGPAVIVEDVSKYYFLQRTRANDLKTTLLTLPTLLFNRGPRELFWALRDISVTLGHGESLGIAGPNGSGKSTLLRLIAAISPPSTGRIVTNGRVSAILDLGAGFHPRISGRENALLNAVLLGLSAKEAEAALPGIIEFSELGDFIDQPMRTYSSGMYVRLGFAVAVHVRPEILLVDEVLAVGDAEFQSKCYAHIDGLRRAGVTIVMASHDLKSIQRYTDRAILLEHGAVIADGKPANVIHQYLTRVFGAEKAAGEAR